MASVTGEVLLPKLGESITQATVVRWLKHVGDTVQEDEPLLEVATDKVNSEIPAPCSGTLSATYVGEGDEVPVGHLLATIGEETTLEKKERHPFISPAVRTLMQKKGLHTCDLQALQGSGRDGRVTKKDLESVAPAKPHSIRKAIADHMTKSHLEIPQAALFTDIDVTSLCAYVKEEKQHFLQQHGVKLTVTCFLVQAFAEALAAYPDLYAVYRNDAVVLQENISIGIATNTKEGLLVPVIHNANEKPLVVLAKELASLKEKAHNKTLTPENVTGATATLSNFGASGITGGIPIVPHGQTAIIGVGAVKKEVCATEGNAIAIRDTLCMTLAFDHRVTDGMYACAFLQKLSKYLTRDLAR